MPELEKYYQYLKSNGADVAPTFQSFKSTLSDEKTSRTYYEYLRTNKFDAPDTYESFANTLGIKKKEDGISDLSVGTDGSLQSTSQSVSQNDNGIGSTDYPKSSGVLKGINDAANIDIDLSKHISKLPVGENKVGAKTQARYEKLLQVITTDDLDRAPTEEEKAEWRELQNEIQRSASIDVKAEAAKFEAERKQPKIPELNFAAVENVLVEKRNADKSVKDAEEFLRTQPMGTGALPANVEYQKTLASRSATLQKQAEQSKNAVLKANREKIAAPINELVSNPNELKKFFDGDNFNHGYAIQYFDKYVKERGGGSYSRDMMVGAMKQAAEWEYDKPKREKYLSEEYKRHGIDISKYGKDLYDKAVTPKINSLEQMKRDGKAKANDYLAQVKPLAAEIGGQYQASIDELNKLYQNKSLTLEEANTKLAEINNDYLSKVKSLDIDYKNNIKGINKSLTEKYARITKEIESIGKSITDDAVWKSIPEADKKKIQLAQESALKRIQTEKNETKKVADQIFLGASPITLVGKSVASGWEQAMSDFGDYLSFKGFDNSFVRGLKSRRTRAEQLAPAEYDWDDQPFMRAVTTSAVSMGASLPATGAAIGVTLASGGVGLPAVVTTLATGLTAYGLETAQNTGGVYNELMAQGDPSKAISGATQFSEKQAKLIPLYFVGAIGLQNMLKGGLKKTLAGTGLEVAEELPTEYYQGFTQAQATQGFGGDFGQFIQKNPTLALDVIAGTIGQSSSMAMAVKTYKTLFSKAPNPETQFLTDIIQKGGVDVAIKSLQLQVENDVISEEEYKVKFAKIQDVLANVEKVEQIGLKGDDAKAFIAYSQNIKDLTQKINTETDAAMKIGMEQKLKAAKKELTEIASGKGVYVVVTMPGGGNQTLIVPVENLTDATIRDADRIRVTNDALLNKEIQDKKKELGIPDAPDGMYISSQSKTQTDATKEGNITGSNLPQYQEGDGSGKTAETSSSDSFKPSGEIKEKEVIPIRTPEETDMIIKAPVPKGALKRADVQVKLIDPATNELTLKPMQAKEAIVNLKKQVGVIDMIKKCL